MKLPVTAIINWVVLPILLLVVTGGIIIFHNPWSALYCQDTLIDIHSGTIIEKDYFLWINIRTTQVPTAVSKAVAAEHPYVPGKPERLKTMRRLSPWTNHSPHFRFGGVGFQLMMLEELWSIGEYSEPARAHSAKCLLAAWQDTKDTDAADDLIQRLLKITYAREEADEPVTEADIANCGCGEGPALSGKQKSGE